MQQTAMQIMYEELMQHEYTIPLELIVKCKELIEVEKEQIIKGYEQRRRILQPDEDGIMKFMSGEQYYNETYKK